MNLPASEFLFWQRYFEIYGFTRDREDQRAAWLLAMILNTHNASHASKRNKYVPVSPLEFIPDYLGERNSEKKVEEKTVEEQAAEFAAFKASYLAAESKARGQS